MTDARDTSSPPSRPPAVARDDPVEDDGMPTIRVGRAKETAVLFQSRRFVECVEVLKQLLQKTIQGSRDGRNEEDPKGAKQQVGHRYYSELSIRSPLSLYKVEAGQGSLSYYISYYKS